MAKSLGHHVLEPGLINRHIGGTKIRVDSGVTQSKTAIAGASQLWEEGYSGRLTSVERWAVEDSRSLTAVQVSNGGIWL